MIWSEIGSGYGELGVGGKWVELALYKKFRGNGRCVIQWGMQQVLGHSYQMFFFSPLQSHVQKCQASGTVGSVSVVEFWLLTLCSLPNWYRLVTVLVTAFLQLIFIVVVFCANKD